jgi:transcriptional regulator with XRE-family HTH domain
MTGPDLRAIRTRLGLSVYDFGRALGYQGNDNTVGVQIRRYETGARDVPPWIARLAEMYGRYGVPKEFRA